MGVLLLWQAPGRGIFRLWEEGWAAWNRLANTIQTQAPREAANRKSKAVDVFDKVPSVLKANRQAFRCNHANRAPMNTGMILAVLVLEPP
jgi:hypothetical protein